MCREGVKLPTLGRLDLFHGFFLFDVSPATILPERFVVDNALDDGAEGFETNGFLQLRDAHGTDFSRNCGVRDFRR